MGVSVREKEKGSGEWWIFVKHNNKRLSKKFGRDKKAALDAAAKIEAKLTLGDFGLLDNKSNSIPSLSEYSDLWLSGYVQGVRRGATYQRYKGLLEKYIIPVFGNERIDTIKRSAIKSFLVGLYKGGQSKSSVALVRNVLSSMMNHAMDDELIQSNPVSGVLKQLKLESSKRITVEPMTPDEVATFLNICQEGYSEYYPFFLAAFRTGLRLGELLGLHWDDIDWNGRFIQVRRSYKLGNEGPTKNGKERRVDMSDQLIAELNRLHLSRKEEAFREGKGASIVETVFARGGAPMEQNYIRRVYDRILKSAGIRHMRIHDIRHTYASLLLSNGSSLMYVKEQMGHHSIQITVDVYGHLIPNGNRSEVNTLDMLCTPAPNGTLSAPLSITKNASL